jgi:hypothetical protein
VKAALNSAPVEAGNGGVVEAGEVGGDGVGGDAAGVAGGAARSEYCEQPKTAKPIAEQPSKRRTERRVIEFMRISTVVGLTPWRG